MAAVRTQIISPVRQLYTHMSKDPKEIVLHPTKSPHMRKWDGEAVGRA